MSTAQIPAATGRASSGSRPTRGLPRLLALSALLSRRGAPGGADIALPLTAFAITTGLLLTVIGGAEMFFRHATVATGAAAGFAGMYVVLAVVALALLVVPLVGLGGASARLSARRRDERLATLRLLGATSAEVRSLTVLEATVIAAAGAIAGIAVHLVLLPLVGLIPFFGAPIGPFAAFAGPIALAAVPVAVAAVAALSSMAGLRRVSLTPLGVRTRSDVPRIRWIGALIGVAAIAAGYVVLGMLPGLGEVFGAAVMTGVTAAIFAGGLAVLNLIGPPVVAARGRRLAARARTAEQLLAGRELAENARVAWRRVSSLAVISFVAVIGGAGMALMGTIGDAEPALMVFAGDVRTGVVLTLGIAFTLLACSVGVTGAASVLDDAALLRALDRTGMPRATMARSRRLAVMVPLRLAVLSGVVAAAVLSLPVIGMSMLLSPITAGVIALTFLGGFGLVLLALRATRPVVTAVLRA